MHPARRFLCLLSLVFLGIAGCDAPPGYRSSGGEWTYGGIAVAPQDPAGFRAIDALFARDSVRGYYRGSAVPDSDGATFEVLSEHEARDRGSVFYCDTYRKGQDYWAIRHLRMGRIADADPMSYRVLGRGHARDKSRVYADGVPFRVRDVASFEPMDGGFGRDSQRGYYAHIEIPGSDGASFETINPADAQYVRDRSHVYFGDMQGDQAVPGPVVHTVRGADVAAFRVLGHGYASDPRHVWYEGRPLGGADVATFRAYETFSDEADAEDRSGRWSRGVRMAVEKGPV